MKFEMVEKNVNLSEDTKERIYKKVGKLEKFFIGDTTARVKTIARKDKVVMEITIYSGDLIVRAEKEDNSAKAAVDQIVDSLERQIRKNKTKLEKRLRENAFSYLPDEDEVRIEEEKEFDIVRTKVFSVKPMSAEEAILQMNLLGHEFFVFENADTESNEIVYKRKQGGYGLITIK